MRVILCFLICLTQLVSIAQPGNSLIAQSDPAGWISSYKGSMPLVISVPHGGTWNLAEIKDRSCEGAVTATDTYTKELALEISDALSKFYGMRPYLVVCNISRKDVDQNRELEEGTCGDPTMAVPWATFHDYIDSALADAVRKYGACLYIDLHGHGHPIQRLELGYLINDKKLTKYFNQEEIIQASTTSLGNLLSIQQGEVLRKWLFGSSSFGTLMTEKGFPSVPSQQDPYPMDGDKYFNGGYNTKRYTGPNYPNVFGWQIECNFKGVRDASGRPAFAIAFSEVIVPFLKQFPFVKMPDTSTRGTR